MSNELREVAERLSRMTRQDLAGMLVDTRRIAALEKDIVEVSNALLDLLPEDPTPES